MECVRDPGGGSDLVRVGKGGRLEPQGRVWGGCWARRGGGGEGSHSPLVVVPGSLLAMSGNESHKWAWAGRAPGLGVHRGAHGGARTLSLHGALGTPQSTLGRADSDTPAPPGSQVGSPGSGRPASRLAPPSPARGPAPRLRVQAARTRGSQEALLSEPVGAGRTLPPIHSALGGRAPRHLGPLPRLRSVPLGLLGSSRGSAGLCVGGSAEPGGTSRCEQPRDRRPRGEGLRPGLDL